MMTASTQVCGDEVDINMYSFRCFKSFKYQGYLLTETNDGSRGQGQNSGRLQMPFRAKYGYKIPITA